MSRKPFNTRWAQGVETQDSSTVFQEPTSIRLNAGWEGGADKDAPPAGQENWWHNRVDSALQGVERTGVMAYHPQAIYGIGAPTYATDGNYYESLVSSNSGNDPVSTSGFWRFVGSSFFSGSDPGDIKIVAHNGVPSQGWLKCNGSAVLRASYPRLFSTIGTIWNTGGETSLQFRLPDYRGVFIRGFDDGRGVDISRQFASPQQGTFIASGSGPAPDGITTFVLSPGDPGRIDLSMDRVTAQSYPNARYSNPGNINTPIGTPGYEEMTFGASRPVNATANYWIKY